MIATRRRPFRLPIMAFVKTVGFFAVLYILVRVPFTHKLIFEGPLKPMWAQAGSIEKKFIAPTIDPVIGPLNVMNLTRKIEERNNEIIALKKQLRGAQYEQKLSQQQIRDMQRKPAKSMAATGVAAAPNASGALPVGASAAAPMVEITPSPDETKTAAYWGAMEAENAAAIAQKLDPTETARIFLAMKPDQVAEIMNILPANYNVKLQEVRLSFPKPIGIVQ